MTLPYLLGAWVVSLLLACGITWHYTDKHAAKKLEAIRAVVQVEQKRNVENAKLALDKLKAIEREEEEAMSSLQRTRGDVNRLLVDLRRAGDITLPSAARRVFDASVGGTPSPARADAGNDAPAGAPEAAAGVKLSVLLETAAENAEEHNRCVGALRAWQSWWPEVKNLCEGR
jgi:hypothetical protein